MKSLKSMYFAVVSFILVAITTFFVPLIPAKYYNKIDESSIVVNNAFNIHFPIMSEALKGTFDAFLDILNKDGTDGSIDADGDGEVETLYEEISGVFDTHVNSSYGEQDASYTGNVVGAAPADKTALNNLFKATGFALDGSDDNAEVQIMLKRAPMDGKDNTGIDFTERGSTRRTGAEMIIYYTEAYLDGSDADVDNSRTGTQVSVFASVFTCPKGNDGNPIGDWYLLGTFAGTATTNNFNSGWWGTTNSFDTTSWRSIAQSVNGVDLATNRTLTQCLSDAPMQT